MNRYTILTPSQIQIGAGSLAALRTIAERHSTGKALIITDSGIRQAGILDHVIGAMGRNSVGLDVYDRVSPNPDIATMEVCGREVAAGRYALIIGVGGGSPMDVAKAAAILPANGGRIKPLLGRNLVGKAGIPLCLVPTTAGTGSEVTQAIVIDDHENCTKVAIWDRHVIPEAAIIDPELTIGMPAQLTADTGLDALIHGIEAYTARTSNPIARLYAGQCIRLVAKHLPMAFQTGNDRNARAGMSLAALLGGLAISNGGLGAIHGLAYPLDTIKHLPHGRTVAILAPWVMDFNRFGNEAAYAEIACYLGEGVDQQDTRSASQKAVSGLKNLMASVGLSPNLVDYGIKLDEVELLAKEAYRGAQRLLPSNPRSMTEEDVLAVYRAASRG